MTDADQLHSIATSLRNGISSAASSLSSSSGMAGDDNSAEDFAEFYDAEAPKVLTGSGSVVTVLGGLDAAIVSTAGAYKQAEAVGAGKGSGGSEFQPGSPSDFSAPSIPSCLGPGLPGALGEFQEVIEDGLAAIGVTIPTGDTGKLRSAAGVWDSLNGDLLSAKSSLSGAFSALQGMDIPQKGDILACQEKLETMLGDLAGNADAMGQACTKFAQGIDDTREELMWMIGQMVAEIMLEIALGAVLGAITGGLGAVAMAAKAATTIARWIQKIAALIMRLRTFIQAQKAWLRGLIKAVGEGAQSAVATVTVQAGVNFARRNEEGYQQQSLLTAGMSSFVGSSVSSPVGNRLAGSNPSLARNAFAGGTEGAVDGLASSGVESGMNGTPFNPISAMVLGTLVGAGLRPALGGGGGNAPATTGLANSGPVRAPSEPGAPTAPSSPNAPNVPTTPSPGGGAPGGGAPGAAGSGNAPAPVDVSNNGPQPGAGGSPSPANAGGPSSPVDVDGSNAPQPGAGGAPSSPNSGNGPVDVPSGDVPSTPLDTAAPSVDAPSVPDVSAPSVGAPSAPAVDVSAPSVDAPSAAAPAGGVPSVSAPSVDAPSVSAPSVDAPTVSAPSVDAPSVDAPSVDAPSANAPSVDAPSVDVPAVDAPSVDAPPVGSPDATAPTAPDAGAPSAPDGLVPDISTPDTTTPLDVDLPPADAPASPEAGSPQTGAPEAGSPDPSAIDPETAAGVAAAAAAGVGIGVGPKLTNLHPGATGGTPSAPAAPASPDAAAPEAGSPDSTAPDPTAPDSTSPDTDAPEPTDGTDAGDSSSTDPATPPADGPQGNPPSQLTVDEIQAALDAINPNFDASDPSSEYNNNCGNTSSILNDVLNGAPVTEAGIGTLTVPEMQARTGLPQTPMTPDQIADTLRAMGPGSHCVVGIDRSTGTGHWFNAYFDGTDVHALDAQTGEMMPWPPNEPHATNWDASIDMSAVTPSTTDAQAPSTQAPAVPAAPGVDAPNAADGNGTSPDTDAPDTDAPDTDVTDADAAGDRGNQTQPTSPSHASDGSQGPGTTYNGYDIPELTPEIREQLDALASQPDSPIVRNEDGSYSLAEPITVPDFVRTQPHHDMAEFDRQVGLQQEGLNDLSIAEYQHNRDYYDEHGRVAQAEQAAARDLLAQQGHGVTGMDILHGPDQVGGGRADRFDGLGDSGVNRSIGSQWQHRVRDLDTEVSNVTLDIDPSLLPHIHMNVQLGATNANPADLPVRRGSVPDDGGAPLPRTGAGSEPGSGRPSIADRLAGLDGPSSPRAADPGTPPVGGQAAPAAPAASAGDGGSQPTYGPYRSIADALNGADPVGAASEAPTNPIRLPASSNDSGSPEAPTSSNELPSNAEHSVEAESAASDAVDTSVDAHPAEIAADSDDARDIHGIVAEPSGSADGPATDEDGPRKLLSDEEFEALDPRQQYEVALREISIGARTFASDAEAHEYGTRHWPVESMTPEQSDAIAGWVMSPRLWNEMARYDRGYDWVRERVAETDAAIRTSTTPERVVVERGTGTDWWTEELGLRPEQLPGYTLNDRGFFGTSLGTAAAGTQPAIMHLSVPAGTPAVYVDGVRGNAEPGERELVMRNVTHRITRVVRTDDGVLHVFGEVLPHE